MARIRTNNVFGTTTNDPLLVGGTTLNAAGLANLGVVASPDTAVITLDPNRVNGAPEIVIVTAHTSSATSATISRGEFDTSAREHPVGTEWIHGPVAATATDLDGDFGGFWADYTPTNVNVTLGNGVQVARFTRIGDTIHFYYSLLLGSSSTIDGLFKIGLPVAAAGAEFTYIGTVWMLDAGTIFRTGSALLDAGQASLVEISPDSAAGFANATNPFTWAPNDRITISGTYEA